MRKTKKEKIGEENDENIKHEFLFTFLSSNIVEVRENAQRKRIIA